MGMSGFIVAFCWRGPPVQDRDSTLSPPLCTGTLTPLQYRALLPDVFKLVQLGPYCSTTPPDKLSDFLLWSMDCRKSCGWHSTTAVLNIYLQQRWVSKQSSTQRLFTRIHKRQQKRGCQTTGQVPRRSGELSAKATHTNWQSLTKSTMGRFWVFSAQ